MACACDPQCDGQRWRGMVEQCARRALLYHTMHIVCCTVDSERRYHSRQYLWAKLLFLVTAAYYLDRVGSACGTVYPKPSSAVCRTLNALTAAFVRAACDSHRRDVAA